MRFLFLGLLCSISIGAIAQKQNSSSVDLESFMERLFPIQEEDLDYESIYEQLFQLYQNPININKADLEVLQATYLLSPLQITALAEYRSNFGNLISLYELQAIPEWDLNTIENLLPFITLEDGFTKTKPFFTRVFEEKNSYLLFRHKRTWETRKGYTSPDTSASGTVSSRYLGDPNEVYFRFRSQHARDFSVGFTLEKDAGEQFILDRRTKRYGFNYLSFHLTRSYVGKWKTLAIGDFQVSFGQGLVFGAGYSLGKGAESVPTIRRSSLGILPYTAALEYGFFRGIGVTRMIKNWQTTLIISSLPRDGRISNSIDSLDLGIETVSSLSQTGLHRTNSELSTKGSIREFNLGGNVHYSPNSKKWQLGANYLFTSFSSSWVRSPTPYNQFEFSGQRNQISSIFFNYNWKNIFLFGESSLSQSGGSGSVFGIVSSLSKTVDFSMLWRNYDRNFHSFYSSGFSENTRPINEKGIYFGFQYRPSKIWKLNAYYDSFTFPWLKYRVYSPSEGNEWLVRLTYQPKRDLLAFIQLRREEKDRNLSDDGSQQLIYKVSPLTKWNGMISLENQLTKRLFLRSRILWSQVKIQEEITPGLMILQDAQMDFRRWKITGRLALFDAETYDNRLYAFENNVLWTFSVPAFSGKGIRYYLLYQYDFGQKLTAYFRIARTTYTDRETISSGLQEIKGSNQTDTSFMIRYWLR